MISSLGARAVVGKPGLDNPLLLAYSATKETLETLVKNWAAILGPRGIRVNAAKTRKRLYPGVLYAGSDDGNRGWPFLAKGGNCRFQVIENFKQIEQSGHFQRLYGELGWL